MRARPPAVKDGCFKWMEGDRLFILVHSYSSIKSCNHELLKHIIGWGQEPFPRDMWPPNCSQQLPGFLPLSAEFCNLCGWVYLCGISKVQPNGSLWLLEWTLVREPLTTRTPQQEQLAQLSIWVNTAESDSWYNQRAKFGVHKFVRNFIFLKGTPKVHNVTHNFPCQEFENHSIIEYQPSTTQSVILGPTAWS